MGEKGTTAHGAQIPVVPLWSENLRVGMALRIVMNSPSIQMQERSLWNEDITIYQILIREMRMPQCNRGPPLQVRSVSAEIHNLGENCTNPPDFFHHLAHIRQIFKVFPNGQPVRAGGI